MADTAFLPYPENTFGGLISGFLVRDLQDIGQRFTDQYRVLRSGGRIAVLDTCKPTKKLLAPLIRFYMAKVIPAISGLITGQKEAYSYLNNSTAGFIRSKELAEHLTTAGFKIVTCQQFVLGMISVHWEEK